MYVVEDAVQWSDSYGHCNDPSGSLTGGQLF